MKNNENVYSTRDLNLAATLLSTGFGLIGIDYQVEGERNRPVGYFNFEDSESIQDAIKKFWARKLAVEPIEFAGNIRSLKAQINTEYKSPHSKFSTEGKY